MGIEETPTVNSHKSACILKQPANLKTKLGFLPSVTITNNAPPRFLFFLNSFSS